MEEYKSTDYREDGSPDTLYFKFSILNSMNFVLAPSKTRHDGKMNHITLNSQAHDSEILEENFESFIDK